MVLIEPAEAEGVGGTNPPLAFALSRENRPWWISFCPSCHQGLLSGPDGKIYPTPFATPTDARIPNGIRSDLEEAKNCLCIGALRAAVVMARRSMQAAALRLGAPDGTLFAQIDWLASNGKIHEPLRLLAHSIRLVGNDAAHPGGDPIARADADDVLSLCEEFLRTCFVVPMIVDDMKKRRSE